MNRVSVAAIVVAYRPGQELNKCLRALVRAEVSEIVVVNNSVDCDISGLLPPSPLIRLVDAPANLGFGAGNNLGVSKLFHKASNLLLVNPDCVVQPEAIKQMNLTLHERNAGVVGPLMRLADGSLGISGGGSPVLLKEFAASLGLGSLIGGVVKERAYRLLDYLNRDGHAGYASSHVVGEVAEPTWVSGFCMLVSRAAFDSVNGFDEGFFLYFEDVDFCLRLRSRGWPVVLDRSAEALHYESSSTARMGKRSLYADGMARYFERHGSQTQARLAGAFARRIR